MHGNTDRPHDYEWTTTSTPIPLLRRHSLGVCSSGSQPGACWNADQKFISVTRACHIGCDCR